MAKTKKPTVKARKSKAAFDVHKNLPTDWHTQHDDNIWLAKDVEQGRRRFSFKKFFISLFLAVFITAIIFAAWDAWSFSRASQKVFGSGNVFDLLSSGSLKGSERGRVNLLLVGYSVDDPGHPGASLTDSIMLVSLNTSNHTGYTLSIPRDLYVKIPDAGYGKINEAYQDGNRLGFYETGYPSGGMGLLEKVVSENFQVTIDYSVLLNYAAFRDTVNAVGGITVNIDSPDPRGLYDPNISHADGGPLSLNNGPQKLNGQTALNLARARGDAYNAYGFPQADFDRTNHQRQMLLALKDKVHGWSVILNPTKADKIFSAMGNNVKTDLTLSDVLPFYRLFNSINSSNLRSVSLRDINGQNLLTSYNSPSSGSTLIPARGVSDFTAIQDSITQLSQ